MFQLLTSTLLLAMALVLSAPQNQEQNGGRLTEAGIDRDGNVYVISDEGKAIRMAEQGQCLEVRQAENHQTMACSISRSEKPEEVSQSLCLEIFLKNGHKQIIETEAPIIEWHFWNGGQQLAVHSGNLAGKGRHALYDSASSRVIEEIPEPPDETLLPQWAKGPAQISDESVPTGEEYNRERRAWIAKALRHMQKIQPGMKREDLLKVFTIEGGISTRYQRTFAYSECPYIKVDVRFKPVSNPTDALVEDPNDIIESISRPYLDWGKTD